MTAVENPMVAMMAPALTEVFGATFASKEDVERIEAKLDDIKAFCDELSAMIENARDKGGMVAKMLNLHRDS